MLTCYFIEATGRQHEHSRVTDTVHHSVMRGDMKTQTLGFQQDLNLQSEACDSITIPKSLCDALVYSLSVKVNREVKRSLN